VEGFGPNGPKPDDSRLGWFSSEWSKAIANQGSERVAKQGHLSG